MRSRGYPRSQDNRLLQSLRDDVAFCDVKLLHGYLDLGKLDEGEKTSVDALALRDYREVAALRDYIVIDTPAALQLRQFAAMI